MKEIKMGDLKIKKILERRKMAKTKMLGEVINENKQLKCKRKLRQNKWNSKRKEE